jgi:CheY-like chemotaxis protein
MSRHTVLVVEDVASARQALVRLLESAGHTVRVAGTVAQALPMLGDSDTVILDLCLPDGSGRAVLEAARRQRRPIRVAIHSGLDRSTIDARLQGVSPDAVIPKALDADLEALLAWVASAPILPPRL